VCGTQNPHGLKVDFFDDGERVFADLIPAEWQQGWPGVLHGGIVTALLDETIGRVAFLYDRWVQTAKIQVRFVKPAPLGKTLRATGELVRDARRLMEMRGSLVEVETGEVLATAEGTFMRVPDSMRDVLAKQLGGDFSAWEEWLAAARASKAET
jgi:uncharacterized protein (TIGR00369 family)